MADASIGGRLLHCYVEVFQRRANALLAAAGKSHDDEERAVTMVLESKDLRAAFENFAVINRKFADSEVQAVLTWRLRLLRINTAPATSPPLVSTIAAELAADTVVARACLHVFLQNDTWQHHVHYVRHDVGLAFLTPSTSSDLTDFLAARIRYWTPQDAGAATPEGRGRLLDLLREAVGQLSRARFDATFKAPLQEMHAHVQKSQSLQGKAADKLLLPLKLLMCSYPPLVRGVKGREKDAPRTSPQSWTETLEVVTTIARRTHKNYAMKRAICEVMTHVLTPVASYRPFHAALAAAMEGTGGGMPAPVFLSPMLEPMPAVRAEGLEGVAQGRVSPGLEMLPQLHHSRGEGGGVVSDGDSVATPQSRRGSPGAASVEPPAHLVSKSPGSRSPHHAPHFGADDTHDDSRRAFTGETARKHLVALFDTADGWSKKKYLSAALPMQTAIVCAHPGLFHSDKRVAPLFDHIVKVMSDDKDKRVRSLCVECALHLVGHALVFGDIARLTPNAPRFTPGASDGGAGRLEQSMSVGIRDVGRHVPPGGSMMTGGSGDGAPAELTLADGGLTTFSLDEMPDSQLTSTANAGDGGPNDSPCDGHNPPTRTGSGRSSVTTVDAGVKLMAFSSRPPRPHKKQTSTGSCGSELLGEAFSLRATSPSQLRGAGGVPITASMSKGSRRGSVTDANATARDAAVKRALAVLSVLRGAGRKQGVGNGAVNHRWYALCVDFGTLVCRTVPAVGLRDGVLGLLPASSDGKDVCSENTLVGLYTLLAVSQLAHYQRPQGAVEEYGLSQGLPLAWWALGAPQAPTGQGQPVRLKSPYSSFRAPSPLAGLLWPGDRCTAPNLAGVGELGTYLLLDTHSLTGAAVLPPHELFDALARHADDIAERLYLIIGACEKEFAPPAAHRVPRARQAHHDGGTERDRPSIHIFRIALLASVYISPAHYPPAEYFALLARLASHPQPELRETVSKTVLPQIMFLRPALIAPMVSAIAEALLAGVDDLENGLVLLQTTAKLLGLLASAMDVQKHDTLPPLVREMMQARRTFAPLPTASALETHPVKGGGGEHWVTLEAACVVHLAVPNMDMRRNALAVLRRIGEIAAAGEPEADGGVPVPRGPISHAMRVIDTHIVEAERTITETILHCRATGADWSESRENRRVGGFTMRAPGPGGAAHLHGPPGGGVSPGLAGGTPDVPFTVPDPTRGADTLKNDHLARLALYTAGWGFCLGALTEICTWSGRTGEHMANLASNAIALKFDRLLAKASTLDFTHEKKTQLDATPEDRKVLELMMGYAAVMAAGCARTPEAVLGQLAAMLRGGVQDIADAGLVGYALLPRSAARAALDSLRAIDDDLRMRSRKEKNRRQQWLVRGHLLKAAGLVLRKSRAHDWSDAASAERLAEWVDEQVDLVHGIAAERLLPFDQLTVLRCHADVLELTSAVTRLLHRHTTPPPEEGTGRRRGVRCTHYVAVATRQKWAGWCLQLRQQPLGSVRADAQGHGETSMQTPTAKAGRAHVHALAYAHAAAAHGGQYVGLSAALTSHAVSLDASWGALREVILRRAQAALLDLLAGPVLLPPDVAWAEDATADGVDIPDLPPAPQGVGISTDVTPKKAKATAPLTHPHLMVFLHGLLLGSREDEAAAHAGLQSMLRCNLTATALVRATALLALHRCPRVAKLHLVALAHACAGGAVIPRPCIPNVLAAVLCGVTDLDDEISGAAWRMFAHLTPKSAGAKAPPRRQDVHAERRLIGLLAEELPEAGAVLVSLARERLPLFDAARQSQYLAALPCWSGLMKIADAAEADELLALTEAYYPTHPALLQAVWDGLAAGVVARLLSRLEERCEGCLLFMLARRGDAPAEPGSGVGSSGSLPDAHHRKRPSDDLRMPASPSAGAHSWALAPSPSAKDAQAAHPVMPLAQSGHRKKASGEQAGGAFPPPGPLQTLSSALSIGSVEVDGAGAGAVGHDDASSPRHATPDPPWGCTTVVMALLSANPANLAAVLQFIGELLQPHAAYQHRAAAAVVFACGIALELSAVDLLEVLTGLLHAVAVVAYDHPCAFVSRKARTLLKLLLSIPCDMGPVLPVIAAARRRLADLLALWETDDAPPAWNTSLLRVVCGARLLGAVVDASWAATAVGFVASPATAVAVNMRSLAVYTALTARARPTSDLQPLLRGLVLALNTEHLSLAAAICDALSDVAVRLGERAEHSETVWSLMMLVACKEAREVVEASGRICARCLPSRLSPVALKGKHVHRLWVLSRAVLAQLFLVPAATQAVLVDVVVHIIVASHEWALPPYLSYTLLAALLPELCSAFAAHDATLTRLGDAFDGPVAVALRCRTSGTDLLQRVSGALADEFWGGAQLRDADMGEFYLHLVHAAGGLTELILRWILRCLSHFLMSNALARIGTSATALAPIFSVLPSKVTADAAQSHVARCLSLAVLRDRPAPRSSSAPPQATGPPVLLRDKKGTAKAAALSVGWLLQGDGDGARRGSGGIALASIPKRAGGGGGGGLLLGGESEHGSGGDMQGFDLLEDPPLSPWSLPPSRRVSAAGRAEPWGHGRQDADVTLPVGALASSFGRLSLPSLKDPTPTGGAHNYYLPSHDDAASDERDDRHGTAPGGILNTSRTISDFGELSAADSPFAPNDVERDDGGAWDPDSDEEEVLDASERPAPHPAVRSVLLVRKCGVTLLLVSLQARDADDATVDAVQAWAYTTHPEANHVYICPEVWTYATGLLLHDSTAPRAIAVLHRYRDVIHAVCVQGCAEVVASR